MKDSQACVWATSQEQWDSFLNDPALAKALERANSASSDDVEAYKSEQESSSIEDDKHQQNIGARLRAYATPITDDVLRQSIR